MGKEPMNDVTDYQRVWFEAWANGARHWCEMWRHVLDMQQQFLHSAAQQHKRWHVEISDGPSFTDKYGKRSHDIDPERDV